MMSSTCNCLTNFLEISPSFWSASSQAKGFQSTPLRGREWTQNFGLQRIKIVPDIATIKNAEQRFMFFTFVT